MKGIISFILTVSIFMISCCSHTAIATFKIDAVNNTFTADFDGADIGYSVINKGSKAPEGYTTPDACVVPSGDGDKALRLIAEWASGYSGMVTYASWNDRVSGDVNEPLVNGSKVMLSFNLRIDDSSEKVEKSFGMLKIGAGNKLNGGIRDKDYQVSDFIMRMTRNTSGACDIEFMNANDDYKKLCSVDADTWTNVLLVLDFEAGKYDAYTNGYELTNLSLCKESTSDTITLDNLLQVSFFANDYSASRFGGGSKINAAYYIDDIYAKEAEALNLKSIKYIGETGSEVDEVMPHSTPCLSFNNPIKEFGLKLNEVPIASDAIIKQGEEYYIKHETPFSWNTEHRITGTVTDNMGNILNLEEKFTTPKAPEQMIEIIGFCNSDGAYISRPESGKVTAKLRFWQQSQKDYLYMMVLYGKKNGKDIVINLVADETSSSEAYIEDSLEFVVPENITEPCVKLMVWDSLTMRQAYPESIFKGMRTLK